METCIFLIVLSFFHPFIVVKTHVTKVTIAATSKCTSQRHQVRVHGGATNIKCVCTVVPPTSSACAQWCHQHQVRVHGGACHHHPRPSLKLAASSRTETGHPLSNKSSLLSTPPPSPWQTALSFLSLHHEWNKTVSWSFCPWLTSLGTKSPLPSLQPFLSE